MTPIPLRPLAVVALLILLTALGYSLGCRFACESARMDKANRKAGWVKTWVYQGAEDPPPPLPYLQPGDVMQAPPIPLPASRPPDPLGWPARIAAISE